MPIANGFLSANQFESEPYFNLTVGFCPQSTMVQLTNLVEPSMMFHENYAFFSSTSLRMAEHFSELADEIKVRYLSGQDPFVIEIGSNDGITPQHFAAKGIRHLGIEPSSNVAEVARRKGIDTVCKFFDEALAAEITGIHGQADVFLGANVMCHIPAINSVASSIKQLLKPGGVLIFEDPYLGGIQKTSYDQIYDEHAFYFSASSVQDRPYEFSSCSPGIGW